MKLAIEILVKAKALGIPFGKIIQEKAPLEETAKSVERHEARVVPGKIAVTP
jgi:hypothetical protein